MVPTTCKWIFTLFLAVLIPAYWIYYGPANFLWYSDVILFLTFLATLFESRYLASMAITGGLVYTCIWILGFAYTLIAYLLKAPVFSPTAYMFDPEYPLWLRGLSLFHAALPPYLIWLIRRLGYHRWAWIPQIALVWILIFTTYYIVKPSADINLIYGYKMLRLEPLPYLIIGNLVVSLIIAGTHWLMMKFFRKGGHER